MIHRVIPCGNNNDPKPINNAVKAHLDIKTLPVMDWSPHNQNFNVNEAVWDRLEREWSKRQISKEATLKTT